jgi:hypothetical protein
MKQALASEHFSFYNQNHYLEVESLVSAAQADLLAEKVRFLVPSTLPPKERYIGGRDCSQKDPMILKVAKLSLFSSLAKLLFRVGKLRLAYDQFIVTSEDANVWTASPATLLEMSSFQGLYGALILRLTDGEVTPLDDTTGFCPIPAAKGNGMFFSADLPLDMHSLMSRKGQIFFLIAYGDVHSLYLHNVNDPATHFLKREGFVFGERLRDDRHPLLK